MELSEVSDQRLLAQIDLGDEQALRELFDRHAPWLTMRLRRRSADADAVASAVQDTFVGVWRAAGGYRGDAEVGAWLWGIAIRRLIDRLRLRRGPEPVAEQVISAVIPPMRSAEDEALLALEHSDLGPAWHQLPADLRQALHATVIDGLSTREAAVLLGVPQGTVKSRVRRAKDRLRRDLLEGQTP